jgi:ribulose-bisphosphate carboxylase large chain
MLTFGIRYRIRLLEGESLDRKVQGIALEQSVELPDNVISDEIRETIVGKADDATLLDDGRYELVIRYPLANAAPEIVQFLNVLFGNVSLTKGVEVVDVEWDHLESLFLGPAFGIEGVRTLLGIPTRPLSCTALKPMGFRSDELAELAYQFALGGIDLIKDDHGLADQRYAPFEERVLTITNAVERANQETGRKSVYLPNITSGIQDLMYRMDFAVENGCGGVLLAPNLSGLEAMHVLAHEVGGIPIMAHPAFSGSFVTSADQGFSPAFLYGGMYRALGADCSIYPNAGGRFSFSLQECREINESCRNVHQPFKATFPTPGGGVKWEDIPKWAALYGNDTVFLMGGSLYQHPNGIRAAAEAVRTSLESVI